MFLGWATRPVPAEGRLIGADMLDRGVGGIINVASTAAFQPMPYQAKLRRDEGIRPVLHRGLRAGAPGHPSAGHGRSSRRHRHLLLRQQHLPAGQATASPPGRRDSFPARPSRAPPRESTAKPVSTMSRTSAPQRPGRSEAVPVTQPTLGHPAPTTAPDGTPLGRVTTPQRRNPHRAARRSAVHAPGPRDALKRPGLVVVDVAVADDATALAFQQLLTDRWATATAPGRGQARRTAALLPGPGSAGRFGCAGRRDAAGLRRGTAMTTVRRCWGSGAAAPPVRV